MNIEIIMSRSFFFILQYSALRRLAKCSFFPVIDKTFFKVSHRTKNFREKTRLVSFTKLDLFSRSDIPLGDFCFKMFANDNIIIKNEPIENDDTEMVGDSSLHNVIVKREFSPNEFVEINEEYFKMNSFDGDGNDFFESVIVKEEQRLSVVCEETANQINANEVIRKQISRTFECYVCKYICHSAVRLFVHFKKHSASKAFSCKQCDRQFSRSSSLYHHTRIHKSENECGRKCSNSSDSLKHEQTHNDGKVYDCDRCDRKCSSRSTLNQHKLIHTGEKRFACHECGRKFSDSSTLFKHKQIHTGNKPFACDRCDQKFYRNSTLSRHKRTHTGDRPFHCDECDRKFTRNSTLSNHKRTHC